MFILGPIRKFKLMIRWWRFYEIVDNETLYKQLILMKKPGCIEPIILEKYKDAVKVRSMELF